MRRRAPVLALLLALLPLAAAAELAGPAEVIDGNTLVVAGTAIRLHGSDAPALAQRCAAQGKSYACGELARTALMDLVAGARVRCRPLEGGAADRQGRVTATCAAGGFDLAANMVHTGWAVAGPAAPPAYAETERKAREAGRGLWRGDFLPPALWRRAAGEVGAEPVGEVCLRGRLSDEGVECQALRGADGALYTLAGRPAEQRVGEEVCLCGRPVAVSICMQGRTLAPTRLVHPAACP